MRQARRKNGSRISANAIHNTQAARRHTRRKRILQSRPPKPSMHHLDKGVIKQLPMALSAFHRTVPRISTSLRQNSQDRPTSSQHTQQTTRKYHTRSTHTIRSRYRHRGRESMQQHRSRISRILSNQAAAIQHALDQTRHTIMVSKRLKENSSCPYPGLLLTITKQRELQP